MLSNKLVVWFNEVSKEDVGLVGGKGANLGEMVRAGFPVPGGFIITSRAYYQFLKENDLQNKIKHLLGTVDYDKQVSLVKVSKIIKDKILKGDMSKSLRLVFLNITKV